MKTVLINCTNTTKFPVMREYSISGKKYIVKSCFIGKQDIRTKLIKLAEHKAIKEMGL